MMTFAITQPVGSVAEWIKAPLWRPCDHNHVI